MKKQKIMIELWNWCKKEAVLAIAILLAIISAFFVHPDKEYIAYIDFRTLAILFCLMAVMAGLQQIGLFQYVAQRLLKKVSHIRGIVFILIMLCFVSSMLITNDVALITFVPFTFIVLKMTLGHQAEKLIISVVVMQTIAANLGSMLTPIGNPQNLYLYGKADMSVLEFVKLMLPCTLISFGLLVVWCLFFRYTGNKVFDVALEEKNSLAPYKMKLVVYGILFLVCLLTVAHVVPYGITLAVVLLVVFFMDKEIFTKVDYALLFTFVGFFIFIGNMGRIPVFNKFIHEMIDGNEIFTSVIASQFMSNVPAALLLSGFTNQFKLLILGTNLGGLGTVIASMASLISFKYIGREYKHLRGKYLGYFSVANVCFLLILLFYVLIF